MDIQELKQQLEEAQYELRSTQRKWEEEQDERKRLEQQVEELQKDKKEQQRGFEGREQSTSGFTANQELRAQIEKLEEEIRGYRKEKRLERVKSEVNTTLSKSINMNRK